MIKVPYEEIVVKIHEKANIPVSEIEERIQKKMQQLAGLISKEGAAHIIANELGVKLFEQLSGKLQVKNIMKGMRDVETVAKVVQIYEPKEFMKGDAVSKVCSMLVGDETGTIRAVLWGSQADHHTSLSPGSIVKIVGAYVRENNGRMELHVNDRSQVFPNPKNETVKDVLVTARQGTRKAIKDLQENENDVELLGTIVQVFDLKFFEVCPKCGKRAKPTSDLYQCAEHGNVMPAYSYLLNLVLDDGTETIRCVFFRQQVDKVLSRTQDDIQRMRNNSAEFEPAKNNLLGKIVKLTGKANKNAMFNRVEFIVNSVDTNPNPEEELKRVA
jgi:DNA/RNA endonuclease YhcR with UshA esterase domain